jgi:hypothetical protein
MEQSYARDTELLRSTQAALILLALTGSGVMLGFFMQQVIGPLGELRAGMRRMAGNDLAVPLPPGHGWNIGLEDGHAVAPDVGSCTSFKVKLESGQVFLAV